MKRLLTLALLAAMPFALVGCGDGDKDKDHKDHVHKDDAHKDEAKGGGHKHEGKRHDLGSAKAGSYDIKVVQVGHVEKGEGILEIKVGGLEKGAATVRAWAGSEGAEGATKAKADYVADHDDFDVHVEVADPLPADAKWWIEVEPTGGEAVTASFDIER